MWNARVWALGLVCVQTWTFDVVLTEWKLNSGRGFELFLLDHVTTLIDEVLNFFL